MYAFSNKLVIIYGMKRHGVLLISTTLWFMWTAKCFHLDSLKVLLEEVAYVTCIKTCLLRSHGVI